MASLELLPKDCVVHLDLLPEKPLTAQALLGGPSRRHTHSLPLPTGLTTCSTLQLKGVTAALPQGPTSVAAALH